MSAAPIRVVALIDELETKGIIDAECGTRFNLRWTSHSVVLLHHDLLAMDVAI